MKARRVGATVRSVATQRDSGGSALRAGGPAYFPTIDMPTAAWRAWLQLQRRLIEAEYAGHLSPCRVDPGPFTSDDRAERAEAALACRACPALLECATFAWLNGERAYVWAGVDCTPRMGTAARGGQPRDELAALVEPDEPAPPRGAGSRRSPAEGPKTAAVRNPTPGLNVVTVTAPSRHSKQRESR